MCSESKTQNLHGGSQKNSIDLYYDARGGANYCRTAVHHGRCSWSQGGKNRQISLTAAPGCVFYIQNRVQMQNISLARLMSSVQIPVSATSDAVESAVPALDRSLDILELLSTTPTGLTLSELSTQLGFPKNSVFRITQTLLARGYLCRDSESMKFQLTPRLLRLAPPRWGNLSLAEISREPMMALRDETRESIQLGVLHGLEGVIIDQVEGLEPLRIVVSLGLRFPLHNNAPGKLLLAHLPTKQQDDVISQIKLTANTSRTITNKTELRRECERIVSQGYSTDYAESDEGIHCVAAPIIDPYQATVGTIWVTGPAKRLPKSRFRELGTQVSVAAQQISRRIDETT